MRGDVKQVSGATPVAPYSCFWRTDDRQAPIDGDAGAKMLESLTIAGNELAKLETGAEIEKIGSARCAVAESAISRRTDNGDVSAHGDRGPEKGTDGCVGSVQY